MNTSSQDRNTGGINSDILKGQWKQFRGQIKQRWGRLTDDELTQAEGGVDQLVGLIQQRYGEGREQIEHELRNLMSSDPARR
jgi:uncharacterized protein YjbJ (UPF0337 family)